MSQGSQVTTLETQAKPPQAPQQQARGAQQGAQNTARAGTSTQVKSNGHDVALSGRKASLTLHASDGEGGDRAQEVGLNGFMYQIPRGTPVDVPIEVLWILENAVSQKVTTEKDGSVSSRDIPRFAYTVHSVDPEKVAA
jgi:hypothetical protein